MPKTGTQRTLIYIPIAHTKEDMGSLGNGLPGDEAYQRLARARWAEIQQQVQALTLDWSRLKIYQDGLPDTAPEIVRKILAEVQSPNYDLLRWLEARGAEVVGTESADLMKEEYDYLVAVHAAKSSRAKAMARHAYAERASSLLDERDAYIARRIAETLPPGGVGLLFLGQAHQVIQHLAADILVQALPSDRSVKTSEAQIAIRRQAGPR